MSILINIASEFTGKKEFKKAEQATIHLDKQVKKLAKNLGLALSTAAVVQFGKAAAKAFAEDQAGAARLAKTVDNLGLSFANPQITSFIDTLSAASGVIDDQLRPAMQKLLTTTGSVAQSQKLLAQAIDISRGSGIDLDTVTQDLANSYVGITRGLKKYNLGLTQAELQAASFTTIQEKLTAQFSGANAAYLATYAGQMQVLTVAASEAKETIGAGLIDAFRIIAGDTTITDLSAKISKLATNIGDFFRGVAQGFRDLSQMPVIKQLLQLAGLMLKVAGKVAGAFIDPFVEEGARNRGGGIAPSSANEHLQSLTATANAKAAAKAEEAAKKRAAALLASQKKNTAELKKQNLAKKQGSLFDMEQIQIIAALKGKITEEERLRLMLQLALITGNEDQAKKLSDQLADAIDSTGKLKQYINTLPEAPNPFKAWDTWLETFKKNLASVTVTPPPAPAPSNLPNTQYNEGTYVPSSGYVPPTNVAPVPAPSNLPNTQYNQGTYVPSSGYVAPAVVVQIDGREIARSLQDQSMSAGQVAYLDRRTGGF